MCDFTADETRIYAPAESADVATEGYHPQLTSNINHIDNK